LAAETDLNAREWVGNGDGTRPALPLFGFVSLHRQALQDGVASEGEWMRDAAASGRASAHLWTSRQALVVPRSYERAPRWREACAASAEAGWPVQVRLSGGGLVPQGPGVLNLSLVWRAPTAQPTNTDAVYRALCGGLAAAFARLGIAAQAQHVQGSFCDGRYNLAVAGAKLAGTAQSWRRIDGTPVVLAHAVMLVDADPCALTERCNLFEAALGQERRYRPDAVTSVAVARSQATGDATVAADLREQVRQVVAERFSRAPPQDAVHAEA
jgi:lipoate-protein ligase A